MDCMKWETDMKHHKVVSIFSRERLSQEDLANYILGLNKYLSMKKMTVEQL
jgi:hypothetical protein